MITIPSGGEFEIGAAERWGADPALLSVKNEGTVRLSLPNAIDIAQVFGKYETTGTTILEKGTLDLHAAPVEQRGGTFQFLNWSVVVVPTLNIRDGVIIGDGSVRGNLVLGYPGNWSYQPPVYPIISPGGGGGTIGTIAVNGNFHMFSGRMDIEVTGTGQGEYDRVTVDGYAAFIDGPNAVARDVFTNILPLGQDINQLPDGTFPKIPFLTFDSRLGDFANKFVNPAWKYEKDNKQYWVEPTQAIPANLDKKIGGKVWNDNGAQPGVREAGEGVFTGSATQIRVLAALARRVATPELVGLIEEFDRLWNPSVILFETNGRVSRHSRPVGASHAVRSEAQGRDADGGQGGSCRGAVGGGGERLFPVAGRRSPRGGSARIAAGVVGGDDHVPVRGPRRPRGRGRDGLRVVARPQRTARVVSVTVACEV